MSKPAIPDIGEFRQRVTLQAAVPGATAISAAGVPPQTADETWSDVGTYWASVRPQRIRRTIGVDTPKSSLWSLVTMRNPGVPITNHHRFVYQGTRILVIDGVQRVLEQNGYLEIEVTENPQ